jgi:cytoskeleton protein RodZ
MDAPASADMAAPAVPVVAAVAASAAVAALPSPSAPAKAGKAGPQTLVLDAATPSASAYADPRLSKASAPSSPSPSPSPMAASATPAESALPAGAVGSMVLEAQQASWVEVKDAKGNKLISRQIQPGERVPLEGAVPLKLVIGNAPGMHLSFKGQSVDLARYTQSNVARLELK